MGKINNVLLTIVIFIFLISPTLAETNEPSDVMNSQSTEMIVDEPETNTIEGDLTSDTIKKIANRENIPGERLEVLKSKKMKPITDAELIETKVADKKSGNIYAIIMDAKGNEVDRNKFEQQEGNAYKQQYGKKTKELHEELIKKPDTDKINVGIWLSGNIETEESQETSKERHGSIEAPVIAEIKNKGMKIIYASPYAPLIYAELTKKEIQELEAREDVEIIDKEGLAKPEINSAIPTIKANIVWAYTKGSGVKVAVVEDDGIAFANPYISDGIYYKPSSPNIDFHATAVAGVIASTHGTYKGVAPAVYLLSANSQDYYESSLIRASDWALSKGANILSLSWGIESDGYLHIMDKYYDYIVPRYPYPTVTKSAGNTGGRITTPGKAWNVITVGAIDDKNTATWPGDIMAYYSAYIDPISNHGDREKPEVVAVGSRIRSTDMTYPWIYSSEYDGTSFAGPAVAGEAALLMSKNIALKKWPEAIRAIIFASAVHNIEGSSRLSEKDGMGAVVVSEAYNVVARNQVKYATIVPTGIYPIRYAFNATAGKKVRVVISWNSKSTGPYGVDTLKVDLDLRVKRPATGSYVGSSLSHDNNFEIVEFVAPVSGTYTAEISKVRWDSGYPSEKLGFAYSIT
ncbi:MAG TPA: S8 family serine peptidase [candidate division Zixibacteria bacterium]|nr:S8 family serine peptidase [candidate division Zixibacteria bacterium]